MIADVNVLVIYETRVRESRTIAVHALTHTQSPKPIFSYGLIYIESERIHTLTRLKHRHHHHHRQLKVCDLFFSNDKEIISLKQCVINVVVVVIVANAIAIDVSNHFHKKIIAC